jgi:hypothetical protein
MRRTKTKLNDKTKVRNCRWEGSQNKHTIKTFFVEGAATEWRRQQICTFPTLTIRESLHTWHASSIISSQRQGSCLSDSPNSRVGCMHISSECILSLKLFENRERNLGTGKCYCRYISYLAETEFLHTPKVCSHSCTWQLVHLDLLNRGMLPKEEKDAHKIEQINRIALATGTEYR